MLHAFGMLLLVLSLNAVSARNMHTDDACIAADPSPATSNSFIQKHVRSSKGGVRLMAEKPEVVLKGGTIKGVTETVVDPSATFDVDEFFDVQYATADRWTEPKLYTGEQQSPLHEEPFKQCAQIDGLGVSGEEDCLFLDVLTPAAGASQPSDRSSWSLPVMVYLHGGGLLFGSKHNYNFKDGLKSFVLEEVIIVTINYRLNVFGWWTNPLDSSQGLWGLQDQIMALRWVKENIRNFGGNPGSVTIFGQSGGGLAVTALYASPVVAAEGLIHKAIAQSPGWQTSAQFHEPADRAADTFGRECLNQISWWTWACAHRQGEDLVNCAREEVNAYTLGWKCLFFSQPQIILKGGNVGNAVMAGYDGHFLMRGLYESACHGEDNTGSDVPLLIGSLENEWTFWERVPYGGPIVNEVVQYHKGDIFDYFLRSRLGGDPSYADASNAQKTCVREEFESCYNDHPDQFPDIAYPAMDVDPWKDSTKGQSLRQQLLTDTVFTVGPQLLSTVKGANKYRYIMTTTGTGTQVDDARDSAHTDDLCYFHLENMTHWKKATALSGDEGGCAGTAVFSAGKMLRQYWTQFAKHGEPSSKVAKDEFGIEDWSPVDRDEGLLGVPYMHLDLRTDGKGSGMKQQPIASKDSAMLTANVACHKTSLEDIGQCSDK